LFEQIFLLVFLARYYFDVLDEESSYFHPLFLYNFLVLFACSKGTKKPRLYKVLMIFYVRFLPRHASRSPSKSKPLLNFVTWLTSAWLAYALRSKTFLEKLLTLY
jgi:hypothetical protein